jgi:hypothetical protein
MKSFDRLRMKSFDRLRMESFDRLRMKSFDRLRMIRTTVLAGIDGCPQTEAFMSQKEVQSLMLSLSKRAVWRRQGDATRGPA